MAGLTSAGAERYLKHFLGISSYSFSYYNNDTSFKGGFLALYASDPGLSPSEPTLCSASNGGAFTTAEFTAPNPDRWAIYQNSFLNSGSISAGTYTHFAIFEKPGGNCNFVGELDSSVVHGGGTLKSSVGFKAGIWALTPSPSPYDYPIIDTTATASILVAKTASASVSSSASSTSDSIASRLASATASCSCSATASSFHDKVVSASVACSASATASADSFGFVDATATASFTASCNASNASFATATASAAFTATCDASIVTPVASCAVTFTATCALQPLPTTSTTLFCAIEERTVCNVSASLLTVCNVSLLNVTDLPSSGIIST